MYCAHNVPSDDRGEVMQANQLKSQVVSLKQLTPTILEVTCQPEQAVSFQPGQYMELAFPRLETDQEDAFWPMAIASAPEDETLSFAIRQSPGSRTAPYLAQLQVGNTIKLKGPQGSFVFQSTPGREICMIGTGTGFAPLRSMMCAATFQAQRPTTTVLLGVKNEEELLYKEELEVMDFVTLIPVLELPGDTWQGAKGWVTDVLAEASTSLNWSATDFYLCGQSEMHKAATSILLERGVPESAIFPAW